MKHPFDIFAEQFHKAADAYERQIKQGLKGVHEPSSHGYGPSGPPKGWSKTPQAKQRAGESRAGYQYRTSTRGVTRQGVSTEIHRQKLKEIRSMPKPKLPE